MKKVYRSIYLLLILAQKSYAVLDAHQLHGYFIANYDQFGGNLKSAYTHYKELLSQDASVYCYKGYIDLLYTTGNFNHILPMVKVLDTVYNDEDTQFKFAQAYERTGNKEEADKRFISLNDKHKSNQEIAFNAANSYMRRKEPENALKIIDNLLNNSPRKPNNFIFHFMKAQIYIQLNNKEQALKSVQKALDMHPKFDKGWLLYALLNEQTGQLDDAIKGYTSFLEASHGTNRDIEQHLIQLIFKQKMASQKAKSSIVVNKTCFEKALILFDQKKFKQALECINGCLSEKPHDDESKLLKIQILSAMDEPEKAAVFVKNCILHEPTVPLWFKTLHLLTQTNLPRLWAIKILHEIEKQSPDNLLIYLYLADLYTRESHTHTAITYHKKALEISKDTTLKSKILFQLGLLYYQENTLKNMATIASIAQEIHTTFAPLLNLLAYYYASEGNNVELAQQLFDQLPKNKRLNPHFLDTQALIYLHNKEYEKALTLLEKIAKIAPSDYTILVHLAQTYHAQGNGKLALSTLKQAQLTAKTINEKKESESLVKQWNHELKKG